MKGLFIFYALVLLASCQKERNQSTVTQIPPPDTSRAISRTPPDTSVSVLRKHPSGTIPIEPAELQFTIGNMRYLFKINIAAKEFVGRDSLKHIEIDVQNDPSTYQIKIIGTSTQISPGTYPYNIIPCCGGTGNTFAPNSGLFLQWQYDYGIADQDFSLQVLSYENDYLDARFHSSRVSNGIINHLKIIKQ